MHRLNGVPDDEILSMFVSIRHQTIFIIRKRLPSGLISNV